MEISFIQLLLMSSYFYVLHALSWLIISAKMIIVDMPWIMNGKTEFFLFHSAFRPAILHAHQYLI